MAHPSAPASLVLHSLRVKGTADVDALAGITGLDPEQVVLACKELAEADLVHRRADKPVGWALTGSGRAAHARLVPGQLDGPGRAALEDGYRRFLAVNGELLATCTAWQLRAGPSGQVINDHTDAGWDGGVLDRLRAVDHAVRPVLDDLCRAASRYGRYAERLSAALAKVLDGRTEWFTRPGIDSYHTVWFELHEDLLATLGVERSTEGQH